MNDRTTTKMGALIDALVEVLFPPCCVACDELGREPFCELCEHALLPASETHLDDLDGVRVALQYGGPAALALFRLKYQRRFELARPLGRYLAALVSELPPVDLVLPIPISKARLVQRGFNQSRELLRGFPGRVDPFRLERTRATVAQVQLNATERVHNVAGAFRVRGSLRGLRVLLVDDVLTTGATMREAARSLRRAGVREVYALCLLRADDPGDGA